MASQSADGRRGTERVREPEGVSVCVLEMCVGVEVVCAHKQKISGRR